MRQPIETAPNVVQVIRSAVDRLPDSEAAQLDEASKTVAELVKALSELLSYVEGGGNPREAARMRARAALKAAGVVL